MSRIGVKPIKIESGVTVTVNDGGRYGYKKIVVKGPKGELSEDIRKGVDIEVKDDQVVVTRKNDQKQNRAYHGLYRTLIANMVTGVTEGYTKDLEMVGVGYRSNMKGNAIELQVGLNHPVIIEAPEGINFDIKDSTEITVSGIDKQLVGETAAKIRASRKPEPYKGKGIRYKGEYVRRKAGKAAVTTT
jgi:large subunit ribosomal protein L6